MTDLEQVDYMDKAWARAYAYEREMKQGRNDVRESYYRQELARLGFTTETVCRAKYSSYCFRWTGNLITDAPGWLDGRIITWIEFRALRKDGEFHNGISHSRERVANVLATLEDGNEVLL